MKGSWRLRRDTGITPPPVEDLRMTLGVDFSLNSQLSLAAFLGQLAFLVALLVLAFVAKRWFRA